ncbi:MAG: TonB-dependent receptor [Prevotella sp.]|nr:TonB-dependent receptor [Candidatus Prevotella equi]
MKTSIKNFAVKAFIAVAAICFTQNASAKVIEHIADRYIINVDQMDLNGDETLMDLLMMVPDVVSIDGKSTVTDELGKWAVRIDNVSIAMNAEVFLKNTKAKEVKKIKVCINPGIMKGCGGLKTVIDINYRKKEDGVSGKVALEGDTYGNAEAFVNTTLDKKNLTFRTFVQGALEHSKDKAGIKSHGAGEDVKMHLNWDITDKDNLELFAAQNFKREVEGGHTPEFPANYSRFYHFEGVYTRDLGKGAYGLVQAEGDYSSSNVAGLTQKEINPYILFEFGFPFISKNLYMTAGIETGYSAYTDGALAYTDRSRYEDGYIQLDWNVGKFNFSVGDRFRVHNFWIERACFNLPYTEKSTTNNHVTVSAWYDFNDNHTLQATFARRFMFPGADDFFSTVMDEQTNAFSTTAIEYFKKPAYVSEMRYTYQKKDFNLMGIIKNTRQELAEGCHDNALMLGVSSFMHFGILRLTAGVNYFHQRTNSNGEIDYNNYVNLKLVPQVSFDGWRLTSTMIYSSNKSTFMRPANMYLDFGCSKEINEHWLVEGKYHDIAGQNYGNRAFSIGATYSF